MGEKVTVKNKDLKCVVCGNDTFDKVGVRLNSKRAIFWDAEMFARGGEAYICDNCGFSHEFFTQNLKK